MKKHLLLILAAILVLILFFCTIDLAWASPNVEAGSNEPITETAPSLPEETEELSATDMVTEPTEETVHIHDWTDTVMEPTCTEEGYTERVCELCNETVCDSFTNPNGHSWGEWKVIAEATETVTGEAERICSVCGAAESRSISILPSTGHTHSYISEITCEPTCYQTGTMTFTCSCGDQYAEDIAKTPHEYENTVVPATCLLRGYTEHTCNVCGHNYRDGYTEVLPHNYVDTVTQPTCTTDGYTSHRCSNCGDAYIDNKVPAIGHKYEDTVTAPTCTSGGYTTHTCKVCADTYVDNRVPATGHSYEHTIVDPTCIAGGYTVHICGACGDTYIDTNTDPTGHSWTGWIVTKEPTETSTGIKTRSCRNCSATETETIPAVEHTHSYTHIKTNPTCTTEGYTTHTCSTCGHSFVDSYIPAIGHAWGSWVEVIAPTEFSEGLKERFCSNCNAQETESIPRIESPHTHNYSEVERVNPTCEQTGSVVEVCSTCGDRKTTTLPALGHTWVHHHQDEQGHYDVYIMCHCGWSCSANIDYIAAFAAHVNSVDPETRYDHSYYDYAVWVVDVPARDWDVCSTCFITRP